MQANPNIDGSRTDRHCPSISTASTHHSSSRKSTKYTCNRRQNATSYYIL